MTRIGILGGTFDPIHVGHLMAGHTAAEAFDLAKVMVTPCTLSPFKQDTPANAGETDRMAMARLAIQDDPLFELCDCDLKRGGISYALDTVRTVLKAYPGNKLFFIMGLDSLLELHRWHKVDEMLSLCQVITIGRPGVEPPDPLTLGFELTVAQQLATMIVMGRAIEVSSSEIRKRVAEGRSIRYLVPRAVEEYILERKLYRES